MRQLAAGSRGRRLAEKQEAGAAAVKASGKGDRLLGLREEKTCECPYDFSALATESKNCCTSRGVRNRGFLHDAQ